MKILHFNMKKANIEDRIRIEQFTDDFIPEGVIKAPEEIGDMLAFFQKEKTSEVQYIYKVPIPSRNDLEFTECWDVTFPFQYINKGDFIVSLPGIYSQVMKEEDLHIARIDPKLMLQKSDVQSSNKLDDK